MAVRSAAILGLSSALLVATAARPDQQPVEVTTDSVDYCEALARRLPLPPIASPEVTRLRHEGEWMCDNGHVHGGIMRLRRALLLSRDADMQEAP